MSDHMQEKSYSWFEKKPIEQQVEQNEFEIGGKDKALFASSKSQKSLLDGESRPSDAVSEVRKNVEKRMPQGFEFVNRGLMLENGEYYYKDGKKSKKANRKVRDKSSMKAVVDGLKALDNILSENLDLNKKDILRDAFLNVCLACETYINKKNPYTAEGKARKQMVKDFYEQVSWESMRFEQILEGYEGHEEELAGRQWLDVLSDVRVETYENGKDGVKVEKGGAGTSDVFVITDKNGEKKYFKESEGIPEKEYAILFQQKFEELKKKEIEGKTEEERTKNQIIHDRRVLLVKATQRAFNMYCFDYDALKDEFRKCIKKEKMLEFIQRIKPLDYIEEEKGEEYNATVEEQMEDFLFLAEYYFGIRKNRMMAAMATGDAQISKNETITKRNVAASRIAKMLGIENVIVKSKMVDLIVGDKKRRGVLMDEAKGEEFAAFCKEFMKMAPNNTIRYSPEALKQITSLQILDIICGQIDRHDANYIGDFEKQEDGNVILKGIKGIDNDLCCGKIKYNDIVSRGSMGYNRIKNIENGGRLTIFAVDVSLMQKICAIKPEVLDYQMCDLLSKEERVALIDRLMGVKKALLRQYNAEVAKNVLNTPEKSVFIEGKEQWKMRTKQLGEIVEKASNKVSEIKDYSYIKHNLLGKYGAKNS